MSFPAGDRGAAGGGRNVAIRMYRQGLGDCFLLRFPTADPEQRFHVLIDCGVVLGTAGPEALMTSVVEDIRQATGGEIHLLVITHEHWDHVSGFIQAAGAFGGLKVHHLWFAWTEDPADELAARLRHEFSRDLQAVRLALQRSAAAAPSTPGGAGREPGPAAAAAGPAGASSSLAGVRDLAELFGDWQDAATPQGPAGGPRPALAPAAPAVSQAPSADGKSTRAALAAARGLAADVSYRRPGEGPLALPTVAGRAPAEGVRVYVLGPPRDEVLLRRINPTVKGQEVPSESRHGKTAFFLGVMGSSGGALTPEDAEVSELCMPFDQRLRILPEEARQSAFFREHYGFDPPEPASAPAHVAAAMDAAAPAAARSSPPPPARATPRPEGVDVPPEGREGTAVGRVQRPRPQHPAAERAGEQATSSWRRIDEDWLDMAAELALQLDSYTNNTSLVLAFELVPSGKVLLFVGDAQIGNWLSWDQLSWTVPDERAGTRTIRAADLLQRTVLYKVGHHGSHNATVSGLGSQARGLELMADPQLIALIPVDHAMAVAKHWGQMPFGPLLDRLAVKTSGRVLRVDDPTPREQPPPGMTAAGWEEFRTAYRLREEKLYFELEIAAAPAMVDNRDD